MGGTSFDVSVVAEGNHSNVSQATLDFGLVIRSPMIEIATIGAGGGSIATIDRAGLLQIGPESAGADPGPVCYGLGNDRPTVTDANVVLARINPERPIGGKLARLDVDAARDAISRHIGQPLGIDPIAAAEAIVRVANARMAGAIRPVSIERGHDPRKFGLLAFGGGASLHVGALMREVGVERALIPRFPGVTSALGCVIGDVRYDFVQTVNRGLADGLDAAALETQRHVTSGIGLLASQAAAIERTEIQLELDMSYQGQTHTVNVPIPMTVEGALEGAGLTVEAISCRVRQRYREAYGRLLEGLPIRIISLRTAIIGIRQVRPEPSGTNRRSRPGRLHYRNADDLDRRASGHRDCLRAPAPVHWQVIEGPAILEQPDIYDVFVDPALPPRSTPSATSSQ